MDIRPTPSVNLLDRAAIALSALCVLHCLALPLVLIATPLMEEYARNHFHMQMLVFVVPVSVIALSVGYRRHRFPGMLIGGAVGIALLLIGATWAHDGAGLVADRITTVSGSLMLAVAHYTNSRLAKRHRLSLGQSCSA